MNYIATKIIFILVDFITLAVMAQPDVSPLVNSTWNQDSPFSDRCPLNGSGLHTKPGCAAIALGQIWNYYRSFDHGFGVAYYESKGIASDSRDKNNVISTDYSICRFDWENIENTYNSNTSIEQQEAVAQYIYLIGNAIHMNYRTSGSSPTNDGQTLWGMHHHLGANPVALWHYRRYFSTKDWNDKLLKNLREGRPVYYSGVWYGADANSDYVSAGHVFLIDGVDDNGLYHFNFGTALPSQNKYCSLDYINQTNGEAFPGNRDVCYNCRQVMFDDLYPVEGGKYKEQAVVGNKPLILNGDPKLTDLTQNKSERFSVQAPVLNYSIKRDTISIAFWVTLKGEMIIPLTSNKVVQLGPGYYIDNVIFDCKVPKTLGNGEYEVKLYSKMKNKSDDKWQEALECVPFSFILNINGDNAAMHFPINRMADPKIVLEEPVKEITNKHEKNYPGKVFVLKLNNPSNYNFEDTIRVTFHTINGDKVKKLPIAVYEGCGIEYRLLVPHSFIDLSQGNFTIDIDYHNFYEDKWYQVVSKEKYAMGIKDNQQHITSSMGSNTLTYDLSGRINKKNQRGKIYIKNGKKYLVN